MHTILLLVSVLAIGASSEQRYRLIPQFPPWNAPFQPFPLRYWQFNNYPVQEKIFLSNIGSNLFNALNLNNVLPTVTRTVTSIVFNTIYSTKTNFCLKIDSAMTACRKRRGIEEDVQVFVGGQAINPSQVARMASTDAPRADQFKEARALESSIQDGISAQGRFLLPFNPTTQVTVFVTGLTVVTVNGGVQPVDIGGCVPACLTGLQLCNKII